MSDVAQIALVVSIACLLAGAIWAAYDIARRKLEGIQRKELDAVAARLADIEKRLDLWSDTIGIQGMEIDRAHKRLDGLAEEIAKNDRSAALALDELKIDNKAEFQAMKTAFDRFATKQAIAETVGPQANARQW